MILSSRPKAHIINQKRPDLLIRTESTKPSKHKPALFLQASPTRGLARGHAPGGGPRPLARAPTRFTSVEQASEEGGEEGVQAWALAMLLALLLLRTRGGPHGGMMLSL